ncbi:MAG: DUF308 domain-containing protein [Synergistaceae bacterium]|nr:DUF308 domain-containing protein [Synergistaceae bacterium]
MIKSLRINLYIDGIILIILGILTLRYPVEAIVSAGFIIGVGLVASGINYLSGFYFFRLKRFIINGLLDIITGAIMILQPGITAFIIPFVVALWLFTTGITRTCASFWLGGAKIPGWGFMLINGIALILLALFMFISPLHSAFSIMMILACVLIASGVFAILEGYFIDK